MKISCAGVGKRFNRDWIFRNLNFNFENNNAYALTGPNGSGKSTLLQVIAGATISSEGRIAYQYNSQSIEPQQAYRLLSIAAPYLELIEEMTLKEFLAFHFIFKPILPGNTIEGIMDYISLAHAAHKQIRYYSSGMKQRVKLAQAIFSDTACVMLDEPCTNLDEAGIELYLRMVSDYGKNRLLIIGSNDPQEYAFCNAVINVMDFKR